MPTIRAAATGLLLFVLAGSGCGPDASTPQGTAERFLDAHYVHIDLKSALPFTSGVAQRKVEQELALVEGVTIDESTQKPTVHYTLLEEHPEGTDAKRYLYRGDIAVSGGESFQRRWLVTVRQQPEGWRVTNWEEMQE